MMNVKNRTKVFVLVISFQLCALSLSAQNISINLDVSSAMLHVASTDKGMLILKMTESQKKLNSKSVNKFNCFSVRRSCWVLF
jgi:hypothetical protein